MLYWLKRLALNVRGFLAALLATVLPSASPFVRKLLFQWLTLLAIWVHGRLGLDYVPSDEVNGLINATVEGVIGILGTFAVWRAPNDRPTAEDKQNPVVKTATTLPP